jgi:hypothetical protein
MIEEAVDGRHHPRPRMRDCLLDRAPLFALWNNDCNDSYF